MSRSVYITVHSCIWNLEDLISTKTWEWEDMHDGVLVGMAESASGGGKGSHRVERYVKDLGCRLVTAKPRERHTTVFRAGGTEGPRDTGENGGLSRLRCRPDLESDGRKRREVAGDSWRLRLQIGGGLEASSSRGEALHRGHGVWLIGADCTILDRSI